MLASLQCSVAKLVDMADLLSLVAFFRLEEDGQTTEALVLHEVAQGDLAQKTLAHLQRNIVELSNVVCKNKIETIHLVSFY